MFGEIVRGHRLRLGLTQEDLAAATGLSVRSIGRVEAGRIVAPRPATVHLLADAFGLVGADRERFCQVTAGEPSGRPTTAPVPAQLPPHTRGFAGRDDHLARLDAILGTAGTEPTAVVISAVSGTAGVGKTALAVYWAHRVADQFPDGQLYVNLRGFDPGGQVMAPAEAVRGFLDALGVPSGRIPPELDAQAALYRSLLAGRRMLVVLDNARDAEQVRPLLPGTATAVAVVTSRNQLTPLVAADGAHPITLDILSPVEARELLARRLGAGRIAAEPDAVDQIITACARLPLALSIAAARAQQTGFPLAVIAAELGMLARRLDVLDAGDAASQVRAVFSWSYAALTPSAARLFRLLGLHPGPDISVAAVVSFAGRPASEAYRLLTELARANLVNEPVPGRFTCHDLLRVYAAELARSDETDGERRAALHRILDHYVHTGHAAADLLESTRERIVLAPPRAGVVVETLADRRQAWAWVATEYPVLLATVGRAAEAGFDTHAWQLAWDLATYFHMGGHWQDGVATQSIALDAAQRMGDRPRQARGHRSLGRAYVQQGRYNEAGMHYRRAFDLYQETGDKAGRAHVQYDLAELLQLQGRYDEALDHIAQALAGYRAVGSLTGQARALNGIGWCHAQLGDYERAVISCDEAVELLGTIDDQYGEAATLDTLGYAHHSMGHRDKAAACYRRALQLHRSVGSRYGQAETLAHMGDNHDADGDIDAAREAWRQALAIYEELGHPDAEHTRAKLRHLEPQPPDQPAP